MGVDSEVHQGLLHSRNILQILPSLISLRAWTLMMVIENVCLTPMSYLVTTQVWGEESGVRLLEDSQGYGDDHMLTDVTL